MFSSEAWLSNSGEFYNGVATQSLRLDSASTSYLYDTASGTESSTANRAISFWFKRSQVDVAHTILTGFVSGPTVKDFIQFRSDNTLRVLVQQSSASNQTRWTTDQVFRDTSAWYHIFIKYALGESSNADKVKIYVNGSLVDTDGGVATGANVTSSQLLTSGTTIRIGTYSNATLTVNGYLSEFNLIDGTADFDDFGELKNGIWIPIEYTGDYGNSGFRLQFNQTGTGSASSSTIGADTSGNLKHFDSSGIDTEDCDMPDSPENNFATFNTLDKDADYTLSEGNLKADSTVSGYGATKSTFAVTSGKWYWEIRLTGTGARAFIGIAKTTVNPINATNGTADTLFYQGQTGNIWYDGSDQGSYSSTYTTNDIISVALNLDDNEITFYKNGTSGGVAISSIEEGDWTPTVADGSTTFITSFVANFGQDSSFAGGLTGGDIGTETPSEGAGVFKHAVPSGYKALCTANISDDDLPISPAQTTQADDYFNTTLYQSDNIGAGGTQSITDVGFQPDWVWIKNRDSSGTSHTLFDSVRTAGKMLQSDNTSLEASNSQYGYLSSFDSDGSGGGGFTLTGGTTNANFINQGTDDYVSWNWKANGGTTSTIAVDTYSAGVPSIASTVQVNTDARFSIITYTGNATAGATVGHGLGVKPDFMIFKSRSAIGSWYVYHKDLTAANSIYLNLRNGSTPQSSSYNNTEPTDTVITFGNGSGTNPSSPITMVGYIFAEREGYSKFGSYTGNGLSDGTFVYTGFRPAFIIVKRTDTTDDWEMQNTKSSPYNVSKTYIFANEPNAENTSGAERIDFVSNGFKTRVNATTFNASGGTYIYMAFAENPFKYANAR